MYLHISTINLFLRILATETPCSQLIRDMGTDVIPLKRNWSKLSLLLFIANTYINLKSLATLSMDVASSAFLSLVVALTAAFFSLELVATSSATTLSLSSLTVLQLFCSPVGENVKDYDVFVLVDTGEGQASPWGQPKLVQHECQHQDGHWHQTSSADKTFANILTTSKLNLQNSNICYYCRAIV